MLLAQIFIILHYKDCEQVSFAYLPLEISVELSVRQNLGSTLIQGQLLTKFKHCLHTESSHIDVTPQLRFLFCPWLA